MILRQTAGVVLLAILTGACSSATASKVDPVAAGLAVRAMAPCDSAADRLASGDRAMVAPTLERCERAGEDLADIGLTGDALDVCVDAAGLAQNLAKLAPKPGETFETSGAGDEVVAWRTVREGCRNALA